MLDLYDRKQRFNTLSQRQNGRHFPGDIFKNIFLNENVRISIKISLKFAPKGSINNIPALVQMMAWRRPGDRPYLKVNWRVYASLGLNELMIHLSKFLTWLCCVGVTHFEELIAFSASRFVDTYKKTLNSISTKIKLCARYTNITVWQVPMYLYAEQGMLHWNHLTGVRYWAS